MFEQKPLSVEEAKQMNPVTLAFLGDAVYSLYVRERMVRKGGKPSEFQRAASKVVSALFTGRRGNLPPWQECEKGNQKQARDGGGIQPFDGV